VLAYPGDVTNADELTVAVNSFAATQDGLELMVNNAGVAGSGTLMEVSLEDWRWIVDINFMGVVHGARAAIPHLQRNGAGLIINVASAAAFAALPTILAGSPIASRTPLGTGVAARHVAIISCCRDGSSRPCGRRLDRTPA